MSFATKALGLIVIGPPGSGKGTQVAKLKAEISRKIEVLIMSELLTRSPAMKAKVDSFILAGSLVPNDIVNICLQNELMDLFLQPDLDVVVFDGFPRTLSQAVFLDSLIHVRLVLSFAVSDEVLFSRLGGRFVCAECSYIGHSSLISSVSGLSSCPKCSSTTFARRADDIDEQVISKRIAIYRAVVRDLENFYNEKVVEINAEADITEVASRVRFVLSEYGIFL